MDIPRTAMSADFPHDSINTDPTAPIFEVAHYGFPANVLELLPAVMKELGGG